MRISIIVRDRSNARLFALDDFVWRRPLYPRQESRDGTLAAYPDAIPGRLALACFVPRFCRGGSALATRPGEGRPVLHEHAGRPALGTANPAAPTQRHEADRDDYRRQAVSADPRRWADLQKRFWA